MFLVARTSLRRFAPAFGLPRDGHAEEPAAPVVVWAQRWVEPHVASLLRDRRRDVRSLRTALSRGDLSTVARLAGSLRSTGGGYGLAPLGEAGARIESASRAGDGAAASSEIDSLSRLLDRARFAFY